MYKCPYCGWLFEQPTSLHLVPDHFVQKYRVPCPGQAQAPRDENDRLPLWSDEEKQEQGDGE